MERPNNWKSLMLNNWLTETLPLQINVIFCVISLLSCSLFSYTFSKGFDRVRINVTKCFLLNDWILNLHSLAFAVFDICIHLVWLSEVMSILHQIVRWQMKCTVELLLFIWEAIINSVTLRGILYLGSYICK